jgi:nicotinate phosphoribosyltransferase
VEPLLEEHLNGGRRRMEAAELEVMRHRRTEDLDRLDPGVKRIMNPHVYHVSLSQRLWDYKRDLVAKVRGNGPGKTT